MRPSLRLHSPPPLKLAIVGGGPSGFYAASRILQAFPNQPSSAKVSVHIYDRLPTPHGLVRYGVAPDHPDVKNVEHKFDQTLKDPRIQFFGNVNITSSSSSPQASNATQEIQASAHFPSALNLSLSSLTPYYNRILFSYGASSSRPLKIPGSYPGQLSNYHSALDFVNWYNGHPCSHDPKILRHLTGGRSETNDIDLLKGDKRHLTVIGAGNVALDVARIVLRSSTPFLEPSGGGESTTSSQSPGLLALSESDIPEPVLAQLCKSKFEKVDIFARRGLTELAFTNKELREMLTLAGTGFSPLPASQLEQAYLRVEEMSKRFEKEVSEGRRDANELGPGSKGDTRVRKRLLGLLEKASKEMRSQQGGNSKIWGLKPFRSPIELQADSQGNEDTVASKGSSDPPPVRRVEWSLTAYKQEGPANISSEVVSTGESEVTETDMVISSVGYRSEPLDSIGAQPSLSTNPIDAEDRPTKFGSNPEGSALELEKLPFDSKRWIVPNREGRVLDAEGNIIPRVYVSGWLSTGPLGVIASTMMNSYKVADNIISDHLSGESSREGKKEDDHSSFLGELQTPPREVETSSQRIVGKEDWEVLNAYELEMGKKLGKLREKILSVDEMLRVIS
ncbi:nucleotide-binding domain-containing protein [Violaceomyces palustris]|uniref:Nucleotide-binding domain-containing protein n=1 Tax=Violaceomyces palustris TaxID=1673888 RepID=A0ACD0NSY1_9BASI|nr:nucleotide-binding domain-containing protein [Violaceomyces palustris]